MAIADDAVKAIASIGAAIVGVAIVAVIVGQNSQAPNAISAIGTALSSVVGAAVAPVSGGATSLNTSAPSSLGSELTTSDIGTANISGASGLFQSAAGALTPLSSSATDFPTDAFGAAPDAVDAFGGI